MIKKEEIMTLARELSLSPNTIEKDYVLNWVLAGIAQNVKIGKDWVFKGGTCLKKCFFKNYRFSEDLDFTLNKEEQLDVNFLKETFKDIIEWIYEVSGIELPETFLRFDLYENKQGGVSVQGRISYRGPMQRGGDISRIKLDLTCTEKIVNQPERRRVFHPYSDQPEDGMYVHAYSLEEIFAEKIRALAERFRPRDLYDVVHLYDEKGWKPDRDLVRETLRKKCDFKGIAFPTMSSIQEEFSHDEIKKDWERMLAHQIANLEPFEPIWEKLPAVFLWLNGSVD